ncbi:uncharacterized protein N7446_010357 [Penicillium canescens]|uniref:Uncharacterized protein n=1 Tax=Penicillium canescens TaxID=5083 RepID=A0AAD6I818_PENCN|nr:uncharacterized protein N7446_010357 [Penicillium canescens]KAJ6035596.1 hypothetical protein N7460_009771 [Penicillium canescens]KAJ6037718.1 hypothetical protein N7444_010423 [Penicillium canescens]KAJ6054345.1 hypothetical protein N7446_010357 [Penicillium canescens]
MAITELIFPSVKTDSASLKELERDWPRLSKGLIDPNPGLLCAFRGWILTEDGLDVREAYKEFLLFEWDSADSFHAFIGSQQFAAFASSIRHLVTGPPTLQLFETNLSPRDAASAPVVEIIRSSNLGKEVIMGIIGWQNLKEYHDMSRKEIWSETLDSLKSLGKVSQITVGIEAMDLGVS